MLIRLAARSAFAQLLLSMYYFSAPAVFPLSVWQVTPLTFGGKINTYLFSVQMFFGI